MVPEFAKNRTIDLYECIDFPYQWKYRMTLMPDVRAVDTTLFLDRGYWWMFTALVENEECTLPSELFLFYSEELFSTAWIPHPGNPIVSDIRKSRPAGGLFKKDGKLYRPSQHTTDIYGYGIDFNEVLNLSTTDYSENEVNSIRPTRENRILAMHTFTKADELTMVDAFVYRNKVSWPR